MSIKKNINNKIKAVITTKCGIFSIFNYINVQY